MNGQSERQKKLPEEILESQKMRSELLRWKLILCAALGAAGFGLSSGSSSSHIALLALIPLACVYVDLLCTNINLRMILIGRHFSANGDPYESFVEKHRIVFCLEDWALYGSTYALCVVLIFLAISYLVLAAVQQSNSAGLECFQCAGILLSCIIAIVLTGWTRQAYYILRKRALLEEGIKTDKHFVEQLCKKNALCKLFVKSFMKGVASVDCSQ
jgi:hypothetical protein